ncbi:hypothetical protein GCM10027040_30050 [Halomonas shantousis]
MLLLMMGPVIGQLSAFDRVKPAHHSGISTSAVNKPATAFASLHTKAVFSWHQQCDYCSLFQHVPVLETALPQTTQASPPASSQRLTAIRLGYGTLAVFPHALTRAPPAALS